MFSALKIPNYRLWTAGALVSNIGTWMQRVAQDWLVLTILTNHDGTATGITTGLQFLPILFLGPFAGVLADRMNKRKLLLITQSSMGVFATILGVLVATGTAELWHVYLLAFGLGVASAFDAPARQAFVSELVPARELPNAVALNSASFNLARLAGPGVAGLLIAAFGTGPAFLVNAASFGAVIFSLGKMRSEQFQPTRLVARQKGQIRDGLAYVRKRPDLLLIFALAFVVATFGLNFQLTNAMMATDIFHVGAGAFGLLGTIMAIGTLAGALLAARRGKPRMRYLLGGAVGFGAMALTASFMPTFFWYAVMMVPVGLASLTFLNSANTMIQLSVDPAYRGRVLGLYIMVVQGGTPLGAPLVGWLGTEFGARWSVGSGAVLSLVAGLIAVIVVLRRARRTPKLGAGAPARHKAATKSRSKVRTLVPLLGR
nr:MFS transporter [Paeniglutamicibacter psychrophenolicus]